MKKVLSILLAAMLILGMLPATALNVFAEGTYEKATSIAVGDTVILVCESKKMEMSTIGSKNYGEGSAYSGAPTGLVPLTVVAGSGAAYAFKTSDGKYLYWTSSNSLNVNANLNSNTSWNVSFDADGNAVIKNGKDSARQIQWNASSPRFAAYTSTQTTIQLYKLSGGTTPNPEPECTHPNKYEMNDGYEAECGKTGMTNSWYCPDCEETVTPQEEIPALTHSYVDGTCEHCGEPEPVAPEFPEIPETGNYKLITDPTEVLTGGQYVFVVEYEGNYYALGNEISDKIAPVETVVSGEYVYGTAPSWKVGSYDGGLVLFNGTKYLGHSSGANFASAAEPSKWIVQDNEDGTFLLISSADEERAVAYNYNNGNHRFGPYAVENLDNAQYALRLHIYKKVNDGATPAFKGILSFVENGKVTTATPAYGSSYALPDASIEAPTGYTFAGWVEAALKETTAAPEILEVGSSVTVPASKTYYALYTRSETTQGGETVKKYQKASSIAVGDTVVLVYETDNKELSSISTTSTKYGIGVNYSGVPTGAMPLTVVAGNGAAYAFKTDDNKYLYWTSGNSLNVNATLNSNTSWNVTFDANGNATIANGKDSTRKIFWNSSSPRFACYNTTGQKAVQLYVLTEVASGGSTTTTYYTTVVEDTCAHGSYASVNATTVACQYCGTEKAAAASIGGTGYATIEEALNAVGELQTIKLQAPADSITYAGNLYLDLNGNNVGSVVLAGDLFVFDSKATTAAAGAKIDNVNVNYIEKDFTADDKRYIALKEGEGYSVHVLELQLTAVTLRTTQAGIYYKAKIVCDPTLAAATDTYGVVLSVQDMPDLQFTEEMNGDKYANGWSVIKNEGENVLTSGKVFTSGSVFGIFKKGLDNNAARGAQTIYANAYLKLKDEFGGIYVMSDQNYGAKESDEGFHGISFSLKGVMEKLDNQVFSGLSEAQKTRVAQFYKDWESAMSTWNLPAISAAAANLPAAE